MAEELELVKISELPDASNVTATDVFPVVQNNVTKKVIAPIIRKYVVDSLGSAAKASTSDFEPSGSVLEVDLKSQERADEQNKRIDRIEVAAYLLRNNKVFKAYRSKALMLADVANIPANSLVHVVNDPSNNAETNDINGQYHYDGNDFLKLPDGFLDLIKEKSDQVLESSKSYTDGRITSLQQTAATDASTKATAAKDDAIHAAAIDAQLKADDAEESSKKYSDLTKADKAIASDPNVAIALTFKDGERTWLEAGYDGGPTEHSKEILNDSLQIDQKISNEVSTATENKADKAIASDSDVAIAVTFKDGERTWLEAGYDGEPTERSIDVLKKHFSQSSSDFKLSDRFVSLSTQKTGATSISREYPVFQRASGPLITYAQQSSESIYWTWMVNKEAWGGTGLALFYSTDHAAHAPSGIFLFEADSIEGPWVNRGKVYRDDFSGDQTETPSVIYDPLTNKVLMFYQQANVAGSVGAQQTVLATADPNNLTSWTRVGVVLDKEFASQDGDGHCGYFRPFFYCGELLGYSLYGGTNWSNATLWRSKDGGYTWKRDGSMIGWMQDKCKHLASVLNTTQNLCVLTIYEGDVINWRGQPWWVGVVGVAQSGSVGTRNSRLVAAPLSDDFTSLKTKVVDITPPKAAYEAVNGIDYPGNLFVWDGEVYSAYRTNGQKGAIALMKMING